MTARGYEGVAAAVPVTVPYARRTEHNVHWWFGRALSELVRQSGIGKDEIDGLITASYTLRPDTAVALTEYFGLTVRWLEDLPMGGASGPIALRHAARAVEAATPLLSESESGAIVFISSTAALEFLGVAQPYNAIKAALISAEQNGELVVLAYDNDPLRDDFAGQCALRVVDLKQGDNEFFIDTNGRPTRDRDDLAKDRGGLKRLVLRVVDSALPIEELVKALR